MTHPCCTEPRGSPSLPTAAHMTGRRSGPPKTHHLLWPAETVGPLLKFATNYQAKSQDVDTSLPAASWAFALSG